MSATLPRIRPASTRISSLRDVQDPISSTVSSSMPAVYMSYPPSLPRATDIPGRINPLRPNEHHRRTVSLETTQPHWQNDQRTARMKQREHYRYHNAWSKYYYGNVNEREAYSGYLRSVLKQQILERQNSQLEFIKSKNKESQVAVEMDKQTKLLDLKAVQDKYNQMKSYRDENKRMMEQKWLLRERTRTAENMYDREQMKYNPINWSCSLK